MTVFKWFQEWYIQNCDGDCEHCYGVKFGTLDNPGWYINTDLTDTDFEDEEFETIVVQRSKNDLIYCHVEDNISKGHGGIVNLMKL